MSHQQSALMRWAPWVLAVLLVVAAHAAWDYWEARRIQQKIAALAATGAPTSLLQIEHPRPAPSGGADAAPYYLAAAMLASAGTPFAAGDGDTTNVRVLAAERSRETTVTWYTSGTLPTATDVMERELAGKADALRQLDIATGLPFRGFSPGTGYSYQFMQLEQLANLSALRTVAAAVRGDGAAGVASLLGELGLFGTRARPVHNLWGARIEATAMRLSLILNRASLDRGQLDRLAQAFAQADEDDRLTQEFAAFRAGRISAFAATAQYGSTAPGVVGSLLARSSMSWLRLVMRPYRARVLGHQLDVYAQLIDASRAPWSERLDRVRDVAVANRWGDDGYFLVSGGWTAPVGLPAEPLSIASARVARAAIAIEQFRLDHNAMPPATLADLIPAFLPTVPVDPFSGEPLRYRSTESGYTVYSVSADRVDDGGDLVKDRPVIRVAMPRRQQ